MIGMAHVQSKDVRSRLDQLPQYIYSLRDRAERADDFGLTHDDQISRRLPKIGPNDRKEIARGAGLLQRIKMRHAISDVPRCAVSVLPIGACFASLWPNRGVPGPDWMPRVQANQHEPRKAIKLGRYSVCTSSPHVRPRPCSRSQLRKSASYSLVTFPRRPSARKQARDCKQSLSSSRPWVKSLAMLLRAASSQGLASQARCNSDRAGSSLSNAHSDFVARVAALVVPDGNVRRLRDAHPVQIEVASQSGSAPYVCAHPRPESLPASFSRPLIPQIFWRTTHDRGHERQEILHALQSPDRSLSFSSPRLFELIRHRRLLSDQRRVDTSR